MKISAFFKMFLSMTMLSGTAFAVSDDCSPVESGKAGGFNRITIEEEVPKGHKPQKSCLDRICFRKPRIKDSYKIIRETFSEKFVSYVFKDSADTVDSVIVEAHASFGRSTPWFDMSLFTPGKGQGGYIAFYAPHGKILWADVRDIGINSIPYEMVTGKSKHQIPSYRLSPLYENMRDNDKSVAQSMVDRRIISEDSRNTMFVTMNPEAGKSNLLDIIDELTLRYPEVQEIHLNICRSFRGGEINFHDFFIPAYVDSPKVFPLRKSAEEEVAEIKKWVIDSAFAGDKERYIEWLIENRAIDGDGEGDRKTWGLDTVEDNSSGPLNIWKLFL